ncbi:hypothetical protein HKD37_19G053427 [Glycine soja]
MKNSGVSLKAESRYFATWVDVNVGIRIDDFRFTLVDLKNLAYQNEPFIMAEQTKQVFYVQHPCDERQMVTPSSSTPLESTPSLSTSKRTRKATRLKSLSAKPVGVERLLFHMDHTTKKSNEGKENNDDKVYEKYKFSKEKWNQFCQSCRDSSWEDFREEKSAQGNFVAHGRQDDPETDASNRHGLYVDDNPPRLVSHGRVYEWLTTVHHVPLGNDLVKVGVDRKFEMLMLASLYPLTRFNYWDRPLSPSLFDRHILYSLFQKRINMYQRDQ